MISEKIFIFTLKISVTNAIISNNFDGWLTNYPLQAKLKSLIRSQRALSWIWLTLLLRLLQWHIYFIGQCLNCEVTNDFMRMRRFCKLMYLKILVNAWSFWLVLEQILVTRSLKVRSLSILTPNNIRFYSWSHYFYWSVHEWA